MTGDWDLAEECAQEAFAQALRRRPSDGVPNRPGAWLTTTARNRALDRLRRRETETVKLREAAVMSSLDQPAGDHNGGDHNGGDGSGVEDDRLRLIFTCCHPALSLGQLAGSGALAGYHLLPATRADLLRRLGRHAEAAAAYRAALDLATTEAERRYLTRRLSETTTHTPSPP
jgi:predicted RNA polymerase sigma factor